MGDLQQTFTNEFVNHIVVMNQSPELKILFKVLSLI